MTTANKVVDERNFSSSGDPNRACSGRTQPEAVLAAVIEDKAKGHAAAKVAAPDDTNVIDVMAALRASLSGKGEADAPPDTSAPRSAKPR